MELNREQIVKALECCSGNEDCADCPRRENCKGINSLLSDALALIRELTEENEGLEVENEHLAMVVEGKLNRTQSLERLVMKLTDKVASIKADTVRKMQERLKEKMLDMSEGYVSAVVIIDQIAKEMLEDQE